jgi:hypothetical protein
MIHMRRAFAIALAVCLLLGMGIAEEVVGDFSALSWSDAFSHLHGRLAREYAFTDWKGVDWAALEGEFGARIRDAEAANDFGSRTISRSGSTSTRSPTGMCAWETCRRSTTSTSAAASASRSRRSTAEA